MPGNNIIFVKNAVCVAHGYHYHRLIDIRAPLSFLVCAKAAQTITTISRLVQPRDHDKLCVQDIIDPI